MPEESSCTSSSAAAERLHNDAALDSTEELLFISDLAETPLPKTKLAPREEPHEPADAGSSATARLDVEASAPKTKTEGRDPPAVLGREPAPAAKLERSPPRRRLGEQEAPGWSERKGRRRRADRARDPSGGRHGRGERVRRRAALRRRPRAGDVDFVFRRGRGVGHRQIERDGKWIGLK